MEFTLFKALSAFNHGPSSWFDGIDPSQRNPISVGFFLFTCLLGHLIRLEASIALLSSLWLSLLPPRTPEPVRSIHGERANFARLVLGCIQA